MKKFMCDDFLLQNEVSEKLYHDYAKEMPIYDYHCHLNPQEIAENKKYKNITELWLGGDHYKWRAMRTNGITEEYITGNANDKEKFMKWAETVENCIGNPQYHWTHLELKRYFGIEDTLSRKTAEKIWNKCNELLASDDFTARELIKKSNVKVICTTDDPVDSLEHHIAIKNLSDFDTKVLPTFRPDKSFCMEKEGYLEWLNRLSEASGVQIGSYEELQKALIQRLDFFHEVGCRISDHGLEPPVFVKSEIEEIENIFHKKLNNKEVNENEINKFKTAVLVFLGKEYNKRGWAMQLHIGTRRNNNTRMFKSIGVDTGFDTIGDFLFIEAIAKLMDTLDITNELPKTILYTLNPRDNEAIGSLIGCFQGGGVAGKIQFGSGWWFNDQMDGMIKQMVALGNLGLLSQFIGMLTDSRSFLSYTRHEYFRRILCNLIGRWVENGEFPADYELLSNLVKNVSFNNASKYFNISL